MARHLRRIARMRTFLPNAPRQAGGYATHASVDVPLLAVANDRRLCVFDLTRRRVTAAPRSEAIRVAHLLCGAQCAAERRHRLLSDALTFGAQLERGVAATARRVINQYVAARTASARIEPPGRTY